MANSERRGSRERRLEALVAENRALQRKLLEAQIALKKAQGAQVLASLCRKK